VAPKLANAIRELVGQLIKPTMSHSKALERAVGYVLHELHQGLVLKKSTNFKPYIYAD